MVSISNYYDKNVHQKQVKHKRIFSASKDLEVLKPIFINLGMHLKAIAVKTRKNSKYLSDTIRFSTLKMFNKYINDLRAHFAFELIKKKLGNQRKVTIEMIGYESGFSSRTTFYREFIRVTGTHSKNILASLIIDRKEDIHMGSNEMD
jgi:AraC-like DNA-binding protein